MKELSSSAVIALRKIAAFKKHPTPQSPLAINNVLKSLCTPDYMAVVQILEEVAPVPVATTSATTPDKAVSNG